MEKHSSITANKDVVEFLAQKEKELIEKARPIYSSGKSDAVDVIDPTMGLAVLKEDRDIFDAIQLFQQNLNFGEVGDNEIYEFPGFQFDGRKTTLRVAKSKLTNLAEVASSIEAKLSGAGFNIKFPSQLFQFQKKYEKQNLPGKTFAAPMPKTMEMSADDYEKYLETHYKNNGVEKESDGVAFRKPYIHEQVDYRENNEVKPGFKNEYYTETLTTKAKGQGRTKTAKVGERIKVTATAARNSLNPFRKRGEIDNSARWQKIESAVIKIAAVGAGVAVIASVGYVSPGIIIAGAAIGAGVAIGRAIKKRIEAAKEKARDERRKRNQEEDEKGQEKGQGQEPAKGKEKGKEKGQGQGPQHTNPNPGPNKGTGTKANPGPTNGTGTGAGNGSGQQAGNGQQTDTDQRIYGHVDLSAAEEEMLQDLALHDNITKQILLLYQDIQNATDSKTAEELKMQIETLYKQREEIMDRLTGRHDQFAEDLGIRHGR